MILLACGEGPLVLLEEVKCQNCGLNCRYTVFDYDPTNRRWFFPFITFRSWAEEAEMSKCGDCGGPMMFSTSALESQTFPVVLLEEFPLPLDPSDPSATLPVYAVQS